MPGNEKPEEQLIEELLDRWEELREQGDTMPTPEEICRDTPELLPVLKERIERIESVDALLGLGLEPGSDDQELPDDRDSFESDIYELGEEIGRGAFGTVYKGRHIRLDKSVAIKILKNIDAPDREARLLAKVRSRFVVKVEHVGRTKDKRLYLVLEWIEGPQLREYIDPEQPLDEEQAVEWMAQCCRGMKALEDLGIIHQDLKPSNLLIEKESGELKITDFGIAKEVGQEGSPSATASSVANADEVAEVFTALPDSDRPLGEGTFTYNQAVGTPLYMSPEHWSKEATTQSDIYCFGATFYHVLTGEPPFTSNNVSEIIRKHREEVPRSPLELREDLSPEISELIMECLEKQAGSRFQSFQDVAEVLTKLAEKKEFLPEVEDECEVKQREINVQKKILADLQLEYATLAAELSEFHLEFVRIVGIKYAELDEILSEIAMLQARQSHKETEEREEAEARAEEAKEQARQSREEADQGIEAEKKRKKFNPTEGLKKLFRKACMMFHPDKILDEEGKEFFTKIMAKVNAAYEAGDIDELHQILEGKYGIDNEKPDESSNEKLIRIFRVLDEIKQVIIAVQKKIESLKQGDIWALREKVIESRESGEDLLGSMAVKAQLDIDAARENLRRLQAGEDEE